jgi:hypothetical protein
MGLEDVLRCQHLKVNGTQCGSPALRRRRRCYFHDELRVERDKVLADQFAIRRFELPPLEDANAVQVAVMKVLQWLGSGRLDPKIAGLMLYGLQTASCNLKNTTFEAAKATDIVIDRKSVDQTCLNGPQWFAQDFGDEREKPEDAVAIAASADNALTESAPAEAAPAKVCRAQIERNKVHSDNRKRPQRAEIEPPRGVVWDTFRRIFPDAAAQEARVGPG